MPLEGEILGYVVIGGKRRPVEWCPLDDGAVDQDCLGPYQSHQRGKNWIARVVHNVRAPGGLGREFLPRIRGRYYEFLGFVNPGDYLEVGGDYYSGRGIKYPARRYLRVLEVSPNEVIFREAGKPPQGALRPIEEELALPAQVAGLSRSRSRRRIR